MNGLRTLIVLAPFALLILLLIIVDAWKADRHQAEMDRLNELPPARTVAPRPLRHDQYQSARERQRRSGERRRAQR